MKRNNPFITGTIILTLTGLLSRLIGFFYRIYLSRLFGEEGMGVYQLLSPVLSLTFSVTAAGLQTAISKYVAGEAAAKNYKASFRVLMTGLFLSLLLSLPCTGIMLRFSELIAARFLLEPRTASMLRIIALSVPLGAVHSCINGYFYGVKKAGIPAATQLIEQFFRVACVFLASYTAGLKGSAPTINVAVVGLVVGEFGAMVVSIAAVYLRFCQLSSTKGIRRNAAKALRPAAAYLSVTAKLLALSVPLSLTRIVINLLQSVEAVYIPSMLQAYGYDSATALSVYGVLTGMALPLIFFPNALTGSISLMLLPVVSEADAAGNMAAVKRAARKTVYSCLFLGGICTLGFLLLGRPVGQLLFHSELAGIFICSLSFICPFLYLCATLTSILHGLGKAGSIFFVNVSSLLLRLAFVFWLLPRFGIDSYIAGMLLSQIYSAGFLLLLLKKTVGKVKK
ncbi:MAG: polysaccharide biosynthesis protein [Lachnospiraceae bacterium]